VTISASGNHAGSWVSPVSAIASSEWRGRYSAENAIDGNKYTSWISETYDGPPNWIRFDMGATKTVSKVRTRALPYYCPMTLDVQVSDDASDWTTVVSDFTISKEDSTVEIAFDKTNARYIRLWETAFRRYRGTCTEMEVYVE
jgi:hypothetical protein